MDEQQKEELLAKIVASPTYKLAELDTDLLQSNDFRGVRMELEYRKPEIVFNKLDINSTVIVFGGTQILEPNDAKQKLEDAEQKLAASPEDKQLKREVERAKQKLENAPYYEAALNFGKMVTSSCQIDGKCDYVIVTGGGPGIMEAANRGAFEAGGKSIGLNITLPHEQVPNPYITPELCFLFHYFAMRKMHFLLRAKALVVFPGGFGTLDELFDALTLRQTKRMQEIPIILFGTNYWKQVINFDFLADQGVIKDRDLDLLSFVDTPEAAWKIISEYHGHDVDDF